MTKEITVSALCNLEARSLAQLVALASRFSSKVFITMDHRTVNVKSIMGIMGLGLDSGKQIMIEANGEDEQEAISAIEEYLTK